MLFSGMLRYFWTVKVSYYFRVIGGKGQFFFFLMEMSFLWKNWGFSRQNILFYFILEIYVSKFRYRQDVRVCLYLFSYFRFLVYYVKGMVVLFYRGG